MKIENYEIEMLMCQFCCCAGIEYNKFVFKVEEVSDGVAFRFRIRDAISRNVFYIVHTNLRKFNIQWRQDDNLAALSLGIVILHGQEEQIKKTLDIVG